MLAYSAEIIGIDALPVLHGESTVVEAVFRRSFYLRAGPALACCGGEEIGCGPLNVILRRDIILQEAATDWRDRLRPGQVVLSGARMAATEAPLVIGIAAAWSWMPPPVPAWSKASLGAGLRHFEQHVSAWPVPEEGLGCAAWRRADPAGLVAKAAARDIAALSSWAAGGCPADRVPAVSGLVGLGPGLTPSGDDLLGGFLAAMHAIGYGASADALWSSLQPDLARTNAISAAHMTAAAAGRLSDKQHRLLNALLSGNPNEIVAGVRAIMDDEHTSSRDTMAGMTIILHAISMRS